MKGIREEILAQALALFNEKGVGEVSVREIARAAGISHGNLRYHFPEKGELVSALFQRCEAAVDQDMVGLLAAPEDLGALLQIIWAQARHFQQFRFLMDHMVEVCAQFPGVGEGLRAMYHRREGELLALLQAWRAQGWVREAATEADLKEAIRLLQLAVDFGLPFVKVAAPALAPEAMLQAYVRLWLAPVRGWLTAAGRTELDQALAALPGLGPA
jgi:AcrR family transcriptional regulator